MRDMLGLRFGAFAIDYGVVFAVWILHAACFGQKLPDGSYQITGLPALVEPALFVGWFVIPEWLWGATLGKKIVGLRVRKLAGSPLGFGGALLRRICDVFDFWMSFGLVATICHLKTVKRQRVGDLAAGAVVVLAKEEGTCRTEPNSPSLGGLA